jgi:hypothetical protein
MYGTIAVATVATDQHHVLDAAHRWMRERAPHVPGFVAESLLVTDDGRTVVITARFTDRAAYDKLASDTTQQAFYTQHFATHFDDVRWYDGTWELVEETT